MWLGTLSTHRTAGTIVLAQGVEGSSKRISTSITNLIPDNPRKQGRRWNYRILDGTKPIHII